MLVPKHGFTDICPTALKKVISCGCSRCDRKNCSCKTNGLFCSDVCKCGAGDDCENQKKESSENSDFELSLSDDEFEIEED